MVTDTPSSITPTHNSLASRLLQSSGTLWFLVAVIGQLIFAAYILAAYVPPTLSGDRAAWDDTGLIDGFIAGDGGGNVMFITHVLLAAVVGIAGPLQLLEPFRKRLPAVHRVTGRVYLTVAVIMAVGGLWLVWGRGTYLNLIAASAVSINAVLILAFAVMTVSHAIRRDIDIHRRWALRLFVVMSGVWFMRLGYSAWFMTVGPVGVDRTMSGPFDVALGFGCYLVPLAVLELYLRAQRSHSGTFRHVAAGVTALAAGLTGLGVAGATLIMWSPHF